MGNGTDSEEFVLLSRVRAGLKCEVAFAMKAQLEICGSLGRTWSWKTRNEAVATNRSKKLKKSDLKDAENDEVMDQKAKDLGDLGDSMSEKEAKSDVVDLTSDNEPKGHIGESESVREGGSKKDTSMPVFKEELKGGVVEMVYNPMKEEELVCESKPNVNKEMKAEPGVESRESRKRMRIWVLIETFGLNMVSIKISDSISWFLYLCLAFGGHPEQKVEKVMRESKACPSNDAISP
ncbi:hypothetical protein SO802_012015 [Lithocarpus litseifolius]|uniref:Uncharacterized protein n=1 Tax=Lithocarpus litseifolius TaxID=425828 RepID=A0AAW2D2C4_9ROSI